MLISLENDEKLAKELQEQEDIVRQQNEFQLQNDEKYATQLQEEDLTDDSELEEEIPHISYSDHLESYALI